MMPFTKVKNLLIPISVITIIVLLVAVNYYYRNSIGFLSEGDYSSRLVSTWIITLIALFCVALYFYLSHASVAEESSQRLEQLNLSRAELQTIFDALPMRLLVLNRDMVILNTNEVTSQYLKIHKSKIVNKPFSSILGFRDIIDDVLLEKINQSFSDGIIRDRELTLENEKVFLTTIVPQSDLIGHVEKVILMIEDITAVRVRARVFSQDSKMAAVGQLAAGIAHEIRNPLGIIRNYCYLLKTTPLEGADPKITEKAVDTIEKSVEKASFIIENLLNFSRLPNHDHAETNLEEYIKMVVLLHENELKKSNVTVETKCSPDVIAAVDPGTVETILINLLSNAIDATTNGRIQIHCYDEYGYVHIICRDTGVGMDSYQLSKIFEPFYTKKQKTQGTGLGLYVTYYEIQKYEGKIEVESTPGKGTAFHVSLPSAGRG